jgi:hypothetical protein
MDRALSIARALRQPYHTGNILFLYAQVESGRSTQKALALAIEAETLLTQVFAASHPTVQNVQALIVSLKESAETGSR